MHHNCAITQMPLPLLDAERPLWQIGARTALRFALVLRSTS